MDEKQVTPGALHPDERENAVSANHSADAYAELERAVYAALETYSNVHRGSGHNSMVTTSLFEKAREIVLEYLCLKKNNFVVIFCTPARASSIIKQLKPGEFTQLSMGNAKLQ